MSKTLTYRANTTLIQKHNRSPVERLVGGGVIAGLASEAGDLLSGAAGAIGDLGASVGSAIGQASRKLDSVLSGAIDDFFVGSTNRVSGRDLETNRFRGPSTFPDIHQPEAKISGSKTETLGGETGMQFPSELGQYFIELNFVKYQRPAPFTEPKLENPSFVFLPITDRMVEAYAVDLEQAKLGTVLGTAADVATRAGGELTSEAISGSLAGIGARAGRNWAARGAAVLEAMASLAIADRNQAGENEIRGVIGQTFGAIPNPHLTVFFNGVQYRQHQMSWRLAPETPQESQRLKDIVRHIKQRMLPAFESSSISNVLTYPYMVKPRIHGPADGVFDFKWCLISGMSVDYTPNGPSFFAGTKDPTLIDLGISFLEIEYFTSDDFGGVSSAGKTARTGGGQNDPFGASDIVGIRRDVLLSNKGA